MKASGHVATIITIIITLVSVVPARAQSHHGVDVALQAKMLRSVDGNGCERSCDQTNGAPAKHEAR